MIIYFAQQKAPSKNNYAHEIHKDIIISEIKSIDDIKSVIEVNKKRLTLTLTTFCNMAFFTLDFFS